MPTYNEHGYIPNQTAGTEVSSTGEGRYVQVYAPDCVHPYHADGYILHGDPVILGELVGVAMSTEDATHTYITIDTEGIWNLSTVATDDQGASAIVAGDALWIHKTTAVISKSQNCSTHHPFGYALAPNASGTVVIAVKVHFDLASCYKEIGNSTTYFTDSTVGRYFQDLRYQSAAASGSTQGLYVRLRMTGPGVTTSNAFRAYTEVYDCQQSNAYGAHLSLGFGETGANTGGVTGLGCGSRSTIMMPADTLNTGTYAAVQAEFYGAAGGSMAGTRASLFRGVLDGDQTCRETINTAFEFVNIAAGTGTHMLKTDMHTATPTDGLRAIINGAVYYFCLVSA